MNQPLTFQNRSQAEQYLEDMYLNKVIGFYYYTAQGKKSVAGKVDRIALDTSTQKQGIVIIVLHTNQRYEIDKDDFFTVAKLLN